MEFLRFKEATNGIGMLACLKTTMRKNTSSNLQIFLVDP